MKLLILNSLLIVIYIVVGIIDFFCDSEKYYLVIYLIGFIPLIGGFITILTKNSLSVFLLYNRFKNRVLNPSSKWKLVARYDCDYNANLIDDYCNALMDKKFGASYKIISRSESNLNIVLMGSLNIQIYYINNIEDDALQVDVIFSPFEISCQAAKKKVENEIIPVLTNFHNFLNPLNESFTLRIDFIAKNPFSSIFLDNVKLNDPDDFRLNLFPQQNLLIGNNDRVEITKNTITINTNHLNYLDKYVMYFIYLSPDVSKILRFHYEE
jgi:hypothetical protein